MNGETPGPDIEKDQEEMGLGPEDLKIDKANSDSSKMGRQYEKVPTTQRSFGEYLDLLDLKREDLEGKTVLDLGSGYGQPLAVGAKEAGINARVVSLDPKLSLKEERGWPSYLNRKVSDIAVAGEGARLPFQDNSFDYCLAIESLPRYLTDKSEIGPYLREVGRVLKNGGEARIQPLTYLDLNLDYSKRPEIYDPILGELRKSGFSVSTAEFPYVDNRGRPRMATALVMKKPL